MGIGISEIVPAREIEIVDVANKRIAIDTFNWAYQFLAIIRDRFTGEPLRDSKGRTTSHLSGLFYRTVRLIESGIEPVYVFDGEPPEFKERTVEARTKIREEAEIKWKEALAKGDIEKVRLYSQAATKLTDEMVADSKLLLEGMGVPWVQAPSEGEAQCAFMCKEGIVWATASQDFDSLAFGSPRLIRNLNITGRRKVPRKEKYILVKPEIVELEDLLSALGIDRDQLIVIGLLTGTDYNPGGVKGMGPKTALKLVKENKTLNDVLAKVKWEFKIPAKKIFDFYKNPPAEKVGIKTKPVQPEKITELMVEEHEFSRERVEKGIDRLIEFKEKGRQTGLGKFL